MKLKTLIPLILLAFGLVGCSQLQKVVYRIDVPQGNYLEAVQVEQVKAGMSKTQIQYLLGTPVLIDPYDNNRWYYVFLQQKAYEYPNQHNLIIEFNDKGLVSKYDLDKPLPQDPQAAVNNTIISTKTVEPHKTWNWKFWDWNWKFWK